MSESKPSGLRPPSKIGRPCCTLPPRPAVPPPLPKQSMNQMDHLWETHGRRLSEAGLRRGSDTSVVLTEDTDSFIIGDRVWVGGTKPGAIAYIGETQFAPGDWAGVVLDEPIGKNDGSVAGCRYFQCEPKRGIFSRLTRLTRLPISETATTPTALKTPTTPPESVRDSLNKSIPPSLNASTTSLSSTVSQRDLRIGERVIVSSSQGSKTGVLRFMGTTEFAPGEWCGVELDDPSGKNDGSVEGKRYFECRPKYGLFAPMHKVSRSPSSRRSMCIVHKPTGAALNTSVRKASSRESLVSISSIASTASTATGRVGTGTPRRPGMRTTILARTTLQGTLKEKQQEIETLRKERDLERERATKAASQTDQAEQSAVSIKQEYEKYREEMQKAVTEAETALTKLLEEKNALALQLEEEKRRCEDLLFRFEEESVNKDDIQKERTEQSVINTVNENRIKDLERQLLEERERAAQLERDSIKLFETEEELTRLRNELSSAATQEKIQFEDLQSHNKSLVEAKAILEKAINEKSTLVEQYVAQIKDLELKLNEKQKESSVQKESEGSLQKELESVQRSLQEKCAQIDSMKKEYESGTNSLKEELQKARELMENIKKESANEKELLTSKYEKIIEEKDNLMKVKMQALETESQKTLQSQNVALEDLRAENTKKLNELTESFSQQLDARDSKIKEVSLQLDQKISETEKLLSELSAQAEQNKKKDEELSIALKKLEELNEKLKLSEEKNIALFKRVQEYQTNSEENFKIIQEKQKLEQDLVSLKSYEADSSAQLLKLNEELKEKEKELSELRSTTAAQIEELTKRYQQEIEKKSKYIEEVNADVSRTSLLISNLEKNIIELKSIIVSKDEEITNLLEKTSELRDALTLSEQTKTNLESELRVFESNIETLNQQVAGTNNKLSQVTAQKEKLESDIADLVSNSANSSEQLMKYNEDLRNKEKELDEMKDKAFKTENTLKTTEEKLIALQGELSRATSLTEQQRLETEDFKSQVEKQRNVNAELTSKISQYEAENSELLRKVEESESIKENVKQNSAEVLQELTNSKQEIFGLRQKFEASETSHKEEVSTLRKQIADLTTQVTASQEEANGLRKIKAKLESDQSANRWSIEELTEKLTTEIENRSKLEALISEKESNLKQMESKLMEVQKINEDLANSREDINKNLSTSINAMSNEVKELTEKLAAATNTIQVKEDAIIQMKTEAEQAKAEISELNGTVSSIKEEQTRNISKLQEEFAKKETEVKGITEMRETLENNVKTLESQLKTVGEELNSKTTLLQEMEGKMKELQNSKDESMVKLQNSLECEIKAKQIEFEAVVKKNSELEQKQQLLQDLLNTQNTDLTTKESIISKLTAQIKALQDVQTEKVKADQQMRNEEVKLMQNKLDDVNKHNKNLLVTKESLEKLLKEQEKQIEVLTNTVKNKEKESEKNTQNLIEKLNVVSSESARLKEAQSNLEKENKQITAKWTEATNQLKLTHENIKNNYDVAGGDMKQHIVPKDNDILKLQEENETAKSQIDFLNSVIVDMQRKNEALLCKVEVLEMGVPANEADDYTRSTLDKRTDAPRMFCDICDQFDLHETEDCPRQAQDFLETEKVAKSPKKVSVERPYCENCEMFGHDTRDCDDAETF